MIIAGADEAGRGALAGPVVAAIVILGEKAPIKSFKDSKTLTSKQREALYKAIYSTCEVGVGEASAQEIDERGIKEATKKALQKALQSLKRKPDILHIDGCDGFKFDIPSKDFIRGDERYPEISAASIVAKVTRDKKMKNLKGEYACYFFEKHKGYGTSEHLQVIQKYGVSPEHRKTYEPIRTWENQLSLFNEKVL